MGGGEVVVQSYGHVRVNCILRMSKRCRYDMRNCMSEIMIRNHNHTEIACAQGKPLQVVAPDRNRNRSRIITATSDFSNPFVSVEWTTWSARKMMGPSVRGGF